MSHKESRVHSGIHKSQLSKTRSRSQGGGACLGGLHNVDLSKQLSRGIYSWQELGHKSGVVTETAAADRRSTVQQCTQ